MLRALPRLFSACLLISVFCFTANPSFASGALPATVRLPGHVLPALAKASRVSENAEQSRKEAAQPITLTLVLERDDQSGFEQYLHDVYNPHSPRFHHFLKQPEIADRFGPSRAEYDAVLVYLQRHGFRLVQGSKNRITLTTRGTRADAERALAIRIGDYRIGSRTFYANDRDPALPRAIASRVEAVSGLSNLDQPKRPAEKYIQVANALSGKKCKDPQNGNELRPCSCVASEELITGEFDSAVNGLLESALNGEAPKPELNIISGALLGYICIADQLNMVSSYAAGQSSGGATPAAASSTAAGSLAGAGQTVGLLEFDNFHSSDVQDYLNFIGYPERISQLSRVDVDGGAGAPGPGESEVLLDTNTVMSLAPGAKVVVYDAPFNGSGTSYEDVLNAMINDGVTVISNSFASCEDQVPPAEARAIDSVLMNAAAAGISVFNAVGDSGSTCLDGSPNTVGVPADSPNATAVGGTSVTLDEAGTYGSEKWWDGAADTPPTGQGGFGVSKFFATPSYQAGLATGGRSLPDVVASANPADGLFTICQADKGGGCPNGLLFGGTSASAPVWAAITAVMNHRAGSNMGFLNPAIYPLAGSSAFHSATSLGSDFANAGLGSPNVAELYRLLTGGSVGAVSAVNSGIVVAGPAMIGPADGTTHAGVAVILIDDNFNSVPGQTVTLDANSGSQAVITTVNAISDQNNGAARFTITDQVPETVTLTAVAGGVTLAKSATFQFLVPPATDSSIVASLSTEPADGTTADTITVTLKDSLGRPTPGKVVTLSQNGASSAVTAPPSPAVTDSNGQIAVRRDRPASETVTYTATDVTDGNLAVPGNAQVDFTNGRGRMRRRLVAWDCQPRSTVIRSAPSRAASS